jgi:hypothetical protein
MSLIVKSESSDIVWIILVAVFLPLGCSFYGYRTKKEENRKKEGLRIDISLLLSVVTRII